MKDSMATLALVLYRSVVKPGSESSHERSHVPRLPQKSWLFGFDVAYQFASWVGEKTSLLKSAAWIRDNGKTFSVRIAGHTNIWTADALNARAILTADPRVFELSHNRQVAFSPVVGRGMIASNGQDWACGRKVISRCLTKAEVRYLPRYEPHVQNLFSLLPADGSTTVDMRSLLLLFAMDTSTDILLGESTSWLTKSSTCDTEVVQISEALDYCNQVMRLRGDLGFLVYLHWDPKFNRSCKLLHGFVERYIHKASTGTQKSSKPPSRLCFLEGLVSSIGPNKTMVRDHILTALMAGRDTTAALMGFTLWSLARDARVQQRLRDEVSSKLQMPVGSYEDLHQVTYLWWTIKEVLRLYPSIPANDRVAKHDTQLPRGGGLDGTEPAFVPKGRVIDIHVFAIQRDKEAWGQDAEVFRPERWEGLVSPAAFMPFGAGPRTCPGRKDDRGVSNGANSVPGGQDAADL
ncbi:cytochrome P450 52A13 [Podospora australis]|uniref:Cytochrome P450 52A13 n=1 Tax=Podospora australis TaxID=1536484 RepID=A0AAN7AIY9_9PEZI|nr:cytochrome P450 52A13 [Podospora australis]